MVSTGNAGEEDEEAGNWLGSCATVADAERTAIALACNSEGIMNFVLTDSQASLSSVLSLSNGAPGRSGYQERPQK